MRRVVVTGLGLVTPLGNGVQSTWSRLISSSSGIKSITQFDVSDLPSKIAGMIPIPGDEQNTELFDINSYLSSKEQRRVGKFITYGIAAARQAVLDSGLVLDTEEEQHRAGVMVGSGIGGLQEIYETSLILANEGPRRVSPFFIPSALINLASGQISIEHHLKGPNHAVVTACATGAHAIGDAARLIQLGDADVMVVGGTEAAVCRVGMAGFCSMKALSTNFNDTPEKGSRPWDVNRDGFVMGEGSGVMVLEEYEHAKKRGAKIYAEYCGYGLSGDAYHITSPSETGDGAYRAMQGALRSAGLTPESIDYINAHGTSTVPGDAAEISATKRLFENSLEKLSVSSTKSAIGHLLGAAGSVEAIFCVLALQQGILPPTLNLDEVCEEAKGVNLIPHTAQEKKITYAMSNAFGFGGTNSSLIFKTI